MKRYNEAKEMASAYGDELKELEDTLNVMNSTTVSRYRDLYERKGGEQFRPDPSRFTCKCCLHKLACSQFRVDPSRIKALHLLKKKEEDHLDAEAPIAATVNSLITWEDEM